MNGNEVQLVPASEVSEAPEAIAVIGLSGRFPGAKNPDEFWENLKNGVESIRFFTDEELARAGVAEAALKNPSYVKANAILENVDMFDAGFFGFTPREAEISDPQQRLFLECVWEALENAGYDSARCRETIGLYAGVSLNTYLITTLLSERRLIDKIGLLQTSIHNRTDHLTTHAAYKLNLKGPSVTVQTTCSTSLVAAHLACQALLSCQCDIALAGGVTITVPEVTGYLYQEGGIGSPDGHCRAFDAQANGTVNGNGAGIVVLKRLADALVDGDTIRAVIRSTAVNNDGSNKIGYTAPSLSGQAQVIATAQAIAGVSCEEISYIEAHGTGTPLGDPIEIEALSQVFRSETERKGFCAIGSVKTNIGHLDTAAGVAGLIKTILSLERRQIPPSLHFSEPNPRINFADSPFYVNATLSEWNTGGKPRIAGVSSFGIGGTNAHVLVQEAPPVERRPSSRSHHLLVLSARTKTALETMTAGLLDHLDQHPEADLGDTAYTLQVGRRALGQRRAIVCQGREDALSALAMTNISKVVTGTKEAAPRPVAFMFPGQGSQYVNMAVEMYHVEPEFRRTLDHCSEQLAPLLGLRLQDLLFADAHSAEAAEKLKQTAFTQPALFCVEFALAKLLIDWGIEPEAMIGHSIGEYVAACLAEVMSLEDALKIVAMRGRLIQKLPRGAMLSVSLSEKDVRASLKDGLEIAAVNATSLCVVAGAEQDVIAYEAKLLESGVACRRLHTSHAFHSSMMDPIRKEFLEVFDAVTLRPPKWPFISNLTGEWITDDEATSPSYWVEHLRRTVRFSHGLGKLFDDPSWILLEVGPGRALMTIARWHPERPTGQMVLTTLPAPDAKRSSAESVYLALGQLWVSGVDVDWERLNQSDPRGRLPLPTYPFERRRYWIEPNAAATVLPEALNKDPDAANWFYFPSWKRAAWLSEIAPAGAEVPAERWLVFADQAGVGEQMAARLRGSADHVITVVQADGFAKLGPAEYALNLSRPEEYIELFADLERESGRPDHIVHLWGIVPPTAKASAESGPMASPNFYSLLYLAQALGAEGSVQPIKLDIVASNVYDVTGAEITLPEQATLMGPALVIPQEYAGVACRLIDIDFDETGDERRDGLVDKLLEGLQKHEEGTVAYRNGHRWVQHFEQARVESVSGVPNRIRSGGVYLITGGLGGVGLAVAAYLARAAAARLILVGRTKLPPREEWDRYEISNEGSLEGKMIGALRTLESLGAEAVYYSVDVSDRVRLRKVVEQSVERFGPINGLVHAAGVAGGGIIQLKTADKADETMTAKVEGTRALYEALHDQRLDFSMLCSSRSALLGGFGGVDYCAANAFLDAFAHNRRTQTGEFVVSVNWPAWQEVGMLANLAASYRPSRAASPRESLPFGHPLIDSYEIESPDRIVFHSRFDVKSRWALDEHRILGTAVQPGVAYLEMARAAFEKAVSPGDVEISDVYFLTPMRMKDDESSEVRLIFERDGDGYDFYVESALSTEASLRSAWQKHVIGKIASPPPTPPRRADLSKLVAECNQKDVLLTQDHYFDEDLGPRWQCMKRVYLGDNKVLVLMELPDEYNGDLERLGLHPALLDRAAGAGMQFLVKRESSYLPFSYHRLMARAALPGRIYVFCVRRDDSDPNKETTSFDVDIMTEEGAVIVEIENFSHKRLNEVAKGVKALVAGSPGAAEHAQRLPKSEADAEEKKNPVERLMSLGVSSSEGVDVFARILAHNTPPQVIVSPNSLPSVLDWARRVRTGEVAAEVESPLRQSTHARPDVQTTFVAPSSEFERRLAAIWEELLGIDRVGVDDNFFELGGDSVLAIQIMANAKKAGLEFTVQQLFQHPTIAELAALSGGDDRKTTGASDEEGQIALLPWRRRPVESIERDGDFAPWSLLLELDETIDGPQLEKSLALVYGAHDALRFPEGPQLELIDLSDLTPPACLEAVAAVSRRLKSELQGGQAPLLRFTRFQMGIGEKAALLIVAHQVAVDFASTGRLLRDLQSAVDHQPLSSDGPDLREIVERVDEFAQSSAAQKAADYWLGLRNRGGQSPSELCGDDSPSGEGIAVHCADLGAVYTQTLVHKALRAYHTRVEDFLIAGLVKAFCDRMKEDHLWLNYESRLNLNQGTALDEVIGPLTTVAPLVLDRPFSDDAGQFLVSIKEQLRSIPQGGSGFAILRDGADQEIRRSLGSLPKPQIKFSYLGEINRAPDAAARVRLHPAEPQISFEIVEGSAHPITIQSFVHDGRLRMLWKYDRALIADRTVVNLAEQHLNEVLSLIEHCVDADDEVFTPTDFPLAGLNTRKLDKIFKLLEKADQTATR